jgi:hypothetical protein
MTEWLAVIAFCVNSECAFWAKTDTPFNSQAQCVQAILEAEATLVENGATSTLSTCIPIKWIKA